jgi:hypothetical protein
MSFLIYLCIIALILIVSILFSRYYLVERKNKKYYTGQGFDEFLNNTSELFSYLKRMLRYFYKIARQYFFHLLVRFLFFIKLFFHKVYASARGKFFQATIKDKKSVSRFWEHLKEYKQEMEKEDKI